MWWKGKIGRRWSSFAEGLLFECPRQCLHAGDRAWYIDYSLAAFGSREILSPIAITFSLHSVKDIILLRMRVSLQLQWLTGSHKTCISLYHTYTQSCTTYNSKYACVQLSYLIKYMPLTPFVPFPTYIWCTLLFLVQVLKFFPQIQKIIPQRHHSVIKHMFVMIGGTYPSSIIQVLINFENP